jgi:hypothetical protein
MSVLVILKFQGDVARFRQALADLGDEFAKMADAARTSGGGIHHRFGVPRPLRHPRDTPQLA